jgi:hypothetical protein
MDQSQFSISAAILSDGRLTTAAGMALSLYLKAFFCLEGKDQGTAE